MSESTPNLPSGAADAESSEDSAPFLRSALTSRHEKRSTVWTVVSLLLHGLVISALLFFTFTQTSLEDMQKRVQERKLPAEKIEKLAELIRDANMEKLRATVTEIMGIKHEIEGMMPERNRDYAQFVHEVIKRNLADGGQKMAAASRETAAALEAVQRLQKTQEEFARLLGDESKRTSFQDKYAELRRVGDETDVVLARAELTFEDAYFTVSWFADEQQAEVFHQLFDAGQRLRESGKALTERLGRQANDSAQLPELEAQLKLLHEGVEAVRTQRTQLEEKIVREKQELVEAEAEFEKATRAIDGAKSAQQAARAAVDAARKEKSDAETIKRLQEEQKKADEALRAAENHRRESEGNKKKLAATVSRDERELGRFGQRIEQQLSEIGKREVPYQRVKTAMEGFEQDRQRIAGELTAAQERFSGLAGQAAEQARKPVPQNVEPTQVAVRPDPLEFEEIPQMSMSALYSGADELEGLVVKEYRDLRALELSMLRDMAFSRAHANIDTPKPARAVIDPALLDQNPLTTEGLARQKEAIRTALDESTQMRDYCQALLDMLRAENEDIQLTMEAYQLAQELAQKLDLPLEPLTLEDMQQMMADQMKSLAESATELARLTEISRTAKDAAKEPTTEADRLADEIVEELAEAERKLQEPVSAPADFMDTVAQLAVTTDKAKKSGEESRKAEKESKEQEHKEAEKAAHDAAVAAERFSAMLEGSMEMGKAMASAKMVEGDSQEGNARSRMERARAMGRVASHSVSSSVDISGLMREEPQKLRSSQTSPDWEKNYVKVNVPHPELTTQTPGVEGGRHLADGGGISSNWMVVDRWYVVGPWANPGRINRDRKFPPENAVDLDATYPGKDGRVLRWRFMQSKGKMLVPYDESDYSIYYLFTEITSDRDRDVWLSTGSDDKSKIWINDMLVWESGPQLKSWRIDEGFRKVHLRKGVNRILYRLENGWHAVAMSLMFYTGEGF